MFCALILLPYVKNRIYNMTDNNSNTSSDNSESEIKLPDFWTLEPLGMEPRKKVAIKTIHSANVKPRTF